MIHLSRDTFNSSTNNLIVNEHRLSAPAPSRQPSTSASSVLQRSATSPDSRGGRDRSTFDVGGGARWFGSRAVRAAAWKLALVIALLLSACGGGAGGGGGDGAVQPGQDAGDEAADAGDGAEDGGVGEGDAVSDDVGGGSSAATADVFERLRPTCEGCHLGGAPFPAFADLRAFESLIVRDEAFVVPGDADGSELVRLLEGRGERQFTQMPIGEQSFAAMEQAGQTEITIVEVRDWIGELSLGGPGAGDASEPALVRRMTGEQILSALFSQLGLVPEDFYGINPSSGEIGSISPVNYPVHGSDMVPKIHPNAGRHAQERFEALGGPAFLAGRARSQALSPLLGHTLTQTAQAWCRKSVDKQGNDALFARATRADTSAANPEAIRANIRYLFLRMLAVDATDEEVQDLYESVFLVYEARANVRTAWVAVCASMIRDPLWLSY